MRVNVLQPLNRCPYCHDACRPEEAVVCRDCLARHHEPCWGEHGACSACASDHRLVADPTRTPAPEISIRLSSGEGRERGPQLGVRGPARLVFWIQALVLVVLALAAYPGSSTEEAVWGSLATLLVSGLLLLLLLVRRRPSSWLPLWIQTGLLSAGWIVAPILVDTFVLGPREPSAAIWALGASLGALSLGTALFLPKDRSEAEVPHSSPQGVSPQ